MERLAGHKRGGLSRHAKLQKDFAVERNLAGKMAAVIGQEHRVVGRHMDAMSPRVLAFAPRAEEVAGAVEDHHRMLAAIEDVDIILAVDADPAVLFERPAVGKFSPIGIDPVSVVSVSHDHRDIPSRGYFGLPAI